MTSEGKMLSGYVNKYLIERGSFKTEVCQYSFGMDAPTEVTEESSFKGFPIKFPKSARKSTAENSSIMVRSTNDNGLNAVENMNIPELPQTAETLQQRGFGLNLGGGMSFGDTAKSGSGQQLYSSSFAFKNSVLDQPSRASINP